MKYFQPYGVVDTNAPYINGDPSVAQPGSIPPGQAIEHPQREIVAVITSANLAPATEADLTQLAKAIQSRKMESDTDEGTVNQYQVTLAPAPTAYYLFMPVTIKIGNTNTGASTLNVNALGSKAIKNADGSAVNAGQLAAGCVVELRYDGTDFRIIGGVAGAASTGPIYLTTTTTLYVNDATGNDTYDGTQASFSSGIRGPFKTLQRAAAEVNKWNLNGYNVTINVANATYTGPLQLPDPGGSGSVLWQGNDATPASCTITTANGNCVSAAGNKNIMSGFKYTTTGTPTGSAGNCIHAQGGNVVVVIRNFEIGASIGSGFYAYGGAYIRLGGTMKLVGNMTANSFCNGAFMEAILGGRFDVEAVGAQALTLTGSPTYQYFAYAVFLSSIFFTYSSLTGSSGSGQRYNAQSNSVISSGGGGASYFPGTTVGAVSSGGQYI